MPTKKSLAGRRIFITGAGAGIGAATARTFADLGAKVAILDRDGTAARRTSESLRRGHSLWVEGDVVDAAAIDRVLSAMRDSWGGIDDLVNNAGTWDHDTILWVANS